MCALTLLTVQDILVSEVSNSIGNTLFENLFSVVNEKTAAAFFKTNTIYLQKMHIMQLKAGYTFQKCTLNINDICKVSEVSNIIGSTVFEINAWFDR